VKLTILTMKKMSYKYFVFDFDGVVCDSTDECMITSWNAWEAWNSRSKFRTTVKEFTEKDKRDFRSLRLRVRGAGEYYILRRALEESLSINTQDEYDILEKKWIKNLTPFKEIFFRMRHQLRENDLQHWIDLHPVYEDVIKVISHLNKKNMLFIATMKDAESVNLILIKNGLELSSTKLLDQEVLKTKLHAMDIFREQYGCDKQEMIFIDDNVTHLIDVTEASYPIYLSTWGNTLDDHLIIAKQNLIPLLDSPIKLLEYSN